MPPREGLAGPVERRRPELLQRDPPLPTAEAQDLVCLVADEIGRSRGGGHLGWSRQLGQGRAEGRGRPVGGARR
eukprot:11915248-Alexandrium_andersonii.AAC.1